MNLNKGWNSWRKLLQPKRLASLVKKLESATRTDKDRVLIPYILHPGWTEESKQAAISQAMSDWEESNGPVGDRQVDLLCVQFVDSEGSIHDDARKAIA